MQHGLGRASWRGDECRRGEDSLARAFGPLVLALFGCALGLSACGKTMTSADCERVGDHLRAVWDTEAGLALPAEVPKSERAQNAVRAEGEKMQSEWLAQCRRELEGRKVDEKEVDCLMAAKTIEAIQSCASPK